MSSRQYSLVNPVPWIHAGGPIALRVLAQLKTKVSRLGGFSHTKVTLSGGGLIAFGIFASVDDCSYGYRSDFKPHGVKVGLLAGSPGLWALSL